MVRVICGVKQNPSILMDTLDVSASSISSWMEMCRRLPVETCSNCISLTAAYKTVSISDADLGLLKRNVEYLEGITHEKGFVTEKIQLTH